MPNFIDLTGQSFNRLTVIKRIENTKSNKVQWECKCECGKITTATSGNLKNNLKQSCGCLHRETARELNKKNLVGQYFGKLLVIKETKDRSSSGSIMWECQCECGNTTTVPTLSLTGNKTRSCGCITTSIGESNIEEILKQQQINYQREYRFVDLKNDKGNLLRFDFAIFKENGELSHLIEFDGVQHFKASNASAHWSHYSLIDTKRSDELKNNYCESNNIRLIRIPYYKRDIITIDEVI